MQEFVFWLYLINSIFLINHEIESSYWKEWRLFKLPGGITLFLIIHFPILGMIFYGLILLHSQATGGLIISLILSLSGIFAFTAHSYFIKKGHPEFTLLISKFILISILVLSSLQGILTVLMLIGK